MSRIVSRVTQLWLLPGQGEEERREREEEAATGAAAHTESAGRHSLRPGDSTAQLLAMHALSSPFIFVFFSCES